MLKQGKVVDINHLHVSLVYVHASVRQSTTRKHDSINWRRTAFVFSISMAKSNRALYFCFSLTYVTVDLIYEIA